MKFEAWMGCYFTRQNWSNQALSLRCVAGQSGGKTLTLKTLFDKGIYPGTVAHTVSVLLLKVQLAFACDAAPSSSNTDSNIWFPAGLTPCNINE